MTQKPPENPLDEIAVGGGKAFAETQEDDAQLQQLPLVQKITHKNLKARLLGLQEVQLVLQRPRGAAELDEESRNHVLLNPDILLSESSPEAQKMVLQIYRLAYVEERLPSPLWDFGKKSLWYNFIDRVLCSPKPHIRELGVQFFDLVLSRVDPKQVADAGIEFLAKNNLKLIKAVLGIFTEKFEALGGWDSRLSGLALALDRLLLSPHADLKAGIKALLKKLLVAGHGEVLGMLKNAKPAFIEEVLPEKPSGSGAGGPGEARSKPIDLLTGVKPIRLKRETQIDLFKVSEPVSVISKFTEVWVEKVKSLRKWNEKTAEIDQFLTAASAPRLSHGDGYGHIVALGKILLDHSNIHVQICAMRIFGALARGLRAHARPYLRPNFNLLVAKFRDKKVILLEALHAVAKEVFHCLTMEEIYEEVRVFNTERNKDIRLNVLVLAKNLFCFLFETRDMAKHLPVFLKLFSDAFNVYYEDQDLEVRNLTNELVLFILETLEDDAENLRLFRDRIDAKKVKPRSNGKEVKCPVAKAVAIFTEKAKEVPIEDERPQGSSGAKRTSVEKRKIPATDPKLGAPGKPFVYRPNELSEEEARNNLRELLPPEITQPLAGSDWKVKEEGLRQLKGFLEALDPLRVDIRFTKTLFGFLKATFKEYRDSNVLCVRLVFDCFSLLVHRLDSVEDIFFEFVPLCLRKIAEGKFAAVIAEIFQTASKKLGFHKVLYLTMLHRELFANPKIISDVFALYTGALDPTAPQSFFDLKCFALLGLNSQNQATRKSAIAFLNKAASFMSAEGVLEVINGVENKNLAKSLEKEVVPLTKAANNAKEVGLSTPKKSTDLSRQKTTDQPPDKGSAAQSLGSILSSLVKQDWKVRKEAVENYMTYLETNPQHFSVLGVHETFQNINLRLNDSQRVVAQLAHTKFRFLLAQYYQQLKPYHKLIVDSMLENLVDKNVG